jgi:8-oxo-dGTP diphosphatase
VPGTIPSDGITMNERERIVVTAAVVERDGAFLLTRRLDGTHLAGHWEFPGGKVHAGETLEECLAREIREELDADIEVGPQILETVHDYPDRSVELRFFRCVLKSDPRPMMGQEMQWPFSCRQPMTNSSAC